MPIGRSSRALFNPLRNVALPDRHASFSALRNMIERLRGIPCKEGRRRRCPVEVRENAAYVEISAPVGCRGDDVYAENESKSSVEHGCASTASAAFAARA